VLGPRAGPGLGQVSSRGLLARRREADVPPAAAQPLPSLPSQEPQLAKFREEAKRAQTRASSGAKEAARLEKQVGPRGGGGRCRCPGSTIGAPPGRGAGVCSPGPRQLAAGASRAASLALRAAGR
jgi:hypothetical protein